MIAFRLLLITIRRRLWNHRPIHGGARETSNRSCGSRGNLAHVAPEVSRASLPADADAETREGSDFPRHPDGHFRARLFQRLWTYGSGHLLSQRFLDWQKASE